MLWIALSLGIVEGLTEFLPISSTGHLILTSALLGFEGRRAQAFEIFIQLGAILAVVWEFRARLARAVAEAPRAARGEGLAFKLGLAFLPAAILGWLLHDTLLEHLFTPASVAAALIAGALAILLVEALPLRLRTHVVEAVSASQALWIGLAQCLALWPGFSRSAATILGGLGVGLDRRAATEFSFFLAVPTMFAATSYGLLRAYPFLEPSDAVWLGVGFAVSFLVAWASIRWLLKFVSTHSFRVFAWYRLLLGATILLVLSGRR